MSLIQHAQTTPSTLEILDTKLEKLGRNLVHARHLSDHEAATKFEQEIKAVSKARHLLSGYA